MSRIWREARGHRKLEPGFEPTAACLPREASDPLSGQWCVGITGKESRAGPGREEGKTKQSCLHAEAER